MNTLLKVLLLVILAIVAVKLLPAALGLVFLLAAGIVLAGLVGVAVGFAFLCAGVTLAALLAPLWLPLVAIAGIVALVRRRSAKTA